MRYRFAVPAVIAFFALGAVALAATVFTQAKPGEFDPAKSNLVQAAWMQGIGCPTLQAFNNANTGTTDMYADSACPTGDPKDGHNEGLLLAKTGPTANNASAVVQLTDVKGITLTELGYDIRKSGAITASPLGSHCGAGAPRFNVVTATGTTFIGCNSPPPMVTAFSQGWERLRWNTGLPLDPVQAIFIIFDEGQDVGGGPDSFGASILDNIDVNGKLVGHGATDAS